MEYKIGTRGSKLALVQAEYVCRRLQEAYPESSFRIEIIRTRGDLVQNKPLDLIGSKGVFVKEIEEALLNGEVQIGVHSMKDMPAIPAKGLVFARAWGREDARDVLVLREKHALSELPGGAVIGTGSKRRQYQLQRLRPDIQVVDIRGNVDTRLRKMEEQSLDGIVLAAAGLHRLGLGERITQYLEPEEMIPAPAQGILALEIRAEDENLCRMLDSLSDESAEFMAQAEREYLRGMGGDCHVPVGALCKPQEDGRYQLSVMYGNADGSRLAFHVEYGKKGEQPASIAQRAVRAIRRQLAGMVSLVGAGPGDAGLITVKGLCAIRQADCILYDRLIAPELLQEAKRDCEQIYVGKANRHHTMKQEEINRLLVEKSMEYRHVVRLKGGDVYVFGRGGEEGLALSAAGVPFEVIPGISSSYAGLACAGIPITHRGIADGFHVVTAHNRRDQLADIDFASMAKGDDTCVFLMGLSRLKEIVEGLRQAGMRETKPVAVISRATTPGQVCICGTLEDITQKVRQAQVEAPALIVVGEVVNLREKLYTDIIKARKRYLLPNIGNEPSRLAELLENRGIPADVLQVGEIHYQTGGITAELLEQADWLLFTSQHGVEGFWRALQEQRLDVRCLGSCKIGVVGKKTEALLNHYGLQADLVPDRHDSDALAELLGQRLQGGEQILHPGAVHAEQGLEQLLKPYGRVQGIAVYENAETEQTEHVELNGYTGVLFTCASNAERLIRRLDEDNLAYLKEQMNCYSIGARTTAVLERFGVVHVIEAANATYEDLAQLVH